MCIKPEVLEAHSQKIEAVVPYTSQKTYKNDTQNQSSVITCHMHRSSL